MQVQVFLCGKAKDIWPLLKNLADQESRTNRPPVDEPHDKATRCPFCGMDLEGEREVFGPDKRHSCAGSERARNLAAGRSGLED